MLYLHNMYLTFPAVPMFDTQKYFREKNEGTLSHLSLCVILLSPFQRSQGLFHISLRRLSLEEKRPLCCICLLFLVFFFLVVFYILLCHQPVYQEHYCTWLSLFSPDNILRVDKWSCFHVEGNVFIWILYISLWNHDILKQQLQQQAKAIISVNP